MKRSAPGWKRLKIACVALVATWGLPARVWAQGPEDSGGAESATETANARAARELVTRYLDAVKAKKWNEASKLVHPKTQLVIADQRRRLGKTQHAMAPAALEKTDAYLVKYEIAKVMPGAAGTVVVETTEDNFQVQDKGIAEDEKASYLVGKSQGRWYVTDKKRQETFSPKSIQIGYKGYFDPSPTKGEEE